MKIKCVVERENLTKGKVYEGNSDGYVVNDRGVSEWYPACYFVAANKEVELLRQRLVKEKNQAAIRNARIRNMESQIKEIEEQNERNIYNLNLNDTYFSISADMQINKFNFLGDKVDYGLILQGNAFTTKQQALDRVFQIKLEEKARLYRLENECDIDKSKLRKYAIAIDCGNKDKIIVQAFVNSYTPNRLGYFSTSFRARNFIKNYKKELERYFEIEKEKIERLNR